MSERAYRQYVADLVESGHDSRRPKHEVADEIVNHVLASHAAGEPWAAEVLTRWDREGAGRDYTDAHKDLNSVTYITADGKRRRKTASYSRPIRSPESGAVVGQQMQAWWGMSRAALHELRAEIAEQTDRLADVVQAVDQLIAAMNAHPECSTARQAWEAEGRSVDEIDLRDVAS